VRILVTNTFKRSSKKLHRNQISILEKAIEKIESKPTVGELKIGDLAGIRIYKFHIFHQLMLLAYTYNELQNEIILLSFASHEKFYENLKNQRFCSTNKQNHTDV
jgi:mRNA-degrading endonuclease RelE of RelBE toxin-antitoxin system